MDEGKEGVLDWAGLWQTFDAWAYTQDYAKSAHRWNAARDKIQMLVVEALQSRGWAGPLEVAELKEMVAGYEKSGRLEWERADALRRELEAQEVAAEQHCKDAIYWRQRAERMEGALRDSMDGFNVWLNLYAKEECDIDHVYAARKEISKAGGTIGYITDRLEVIRKAIPQNGAGERGK